MNANQVLKKDHIIEVNDFGSHLKNFRMAKKMSRRELAERLNVSTTTIVNWEYNTTLPEVNQLIQLLKILNVTIYQLLNISENYPTYQADVKRQDLATFGKRLEYVRVQKNLTKRDAANNLKITPQSITSWEQGKSSPNLQMLIKLSNLLEVPLDFLLQGKAIYLRPTPKVELNQLELPTREQLLSKQQQFANQLKAKRLDANLSRGKLATELNVAPLVIYKWETARALPSPASLVKVLEYFDLTFDQLIAESEVAELVLEVSPSQPEESQDKVQEDVCEDIQIGQMIETHDVSSETEMETDFAQAIQQVIFNSQAQLITEVCELTTQWMNRQVEKETETSLTEAEKNFIKQIRQLDETGLEMLQSYLNFLISKH